MASLESKVGALIAPSLEAMGYELVRVRLTGGGKPAKRGGANLQIMAERIDRNGMTVEDCADISRNVSAILDVEDPIRGAYTLEVSSPGIDRPLTKVEHFRRFAGFDARVETRFPIDGQKRFRGPIVGAGEDTVTLSVDGADVTLPMEEIASAKLVLTDALIAAAAADVGPTQAAEEAAE